MDWIDYREKLKIGFSDRDKVSYFFTKILNVLNESTERGSGQISEKELFDFCNLTGTPFPREYLRGSYYTSIINILKGHMSSLEEFLAYYIAFINCQEDKNYKPYKRATYMRKVCKLLDESHLPYEIYEDNDGFFIFPKGVEEFDSALVSAPLQWLSAYPIAEKAWSKALHRYSESNHEDVSDVADLFRKALESFFKEFFGNNQSLENNKSIYGRYLKDRGVPAEIRNNLEALLQSYTDYMNGHAKHNDKTNINVLEYLMYQTGNIIRLLITLKANDKVDIT